MIAWFIIWLLYGTIVLGSVVYILVVASMFARMIAHEVVVPLAHVCLEEVRIYVGIAQRVAHYSVGIAQRSTVARHIAQWGAQRSVPVAQRSVSVAQVSTPPTTPLLEGPNTKQAVLARLRGEPGINLRVLSTETGVAYSTLTKYRRELTT